MILSYNPLTLWLIWQRICISVAQLIFLQVIIVIMQFSQLILHFNQKYGMEVWGLTITHFICVWLSLGLFSNIHIMKISIWINITGSTLLWLFKWSCTSIECHRNMKSTYVKCTTMRTTTNQWHINVRLSIFIQTQCGNWISIRQHDYVMLNVDPDTSWPYFLVIMAKI